MQFFKLSNQSGKNKTKQRKEKVTGIKLLDIPNTEKVEQTVRAGKKSGKKESYEVFSDLSDDGEFYEF